MYSYLKDTNECGKTAEGTQVQHDMDPLINMQKSVFLPYWDSYELYGRKSI